MKISFKKQILILSSILGFSVFNNIKAISLADVKVSPEIDLGISYGSIIKESDTNSKEEDQTELKALKNFEASMPISIGLRIGLDFLDFETIKLGFTTGIKYPFKRKLEEKDEKYSIEEQFIELPFNFLIGFTFDSFIERVDLILGYDMRYLLSSKYTIKDDSPLKLPVFNEEWGKNHEDLKDGEGCPHFSGDIVIGTGINLPYGIYFNLILSLPLELYTIEKDSKGKGKAKIDSINSTPKKDKNFIRTRRMVNSALLKFQIGVDIMKIFF